MATKDAQDYTTLLQTSKVTLTMPDPESCAPFIAKANLSGGSVRITIPSDIVELLDIRPNDILEMLVTKRKTIKKRDTDLLGRYDQ